MINLTEACRMNHRSGGTGAGRIWELTSVSWAQAKGGDSDIQWFFYKPAPSKKKFPSTVYTLSA